MSEPINYEIWDATDIFGIEEVVYLWQEKEPPEFSNLCDNCLTGRVHIRSTSPLGSRKGRVIVDLIMKHPAMDNQTKITRKQLGEVANGAGMKPKFLFPEMREGARWNELGTPAKGAYQELIKVLLHGLNHNPKDSSTVGKIEVLVAKFQTDKELNEANISRRTIEGILKEIAPSRKRLPKNAK
jgi:hypothetical protein